MLEAAAEKHGAGDEKKDLQEPSEKGHPPKQTFLPPPCEMICREVGPEL
jgi:hypothetical protein